MTAPECLPTPWGDEAQAVARLQREATAASASWPAVQGLAAPWLTDLRAHPPAFWAMESLLQAYPLSSAQGLALMRLAEALLRIPDADTVQLLLSDQLSQGQFTPAHDSPMPEAPHLHPWWEAVSQRVLSLATSWAKPAIGADGARKEAESGVLGEVGHTLQGVVQQLGQRATVRATLLAVQLLGRQFVLAPDIEEAWRAARITHDDDAQHGLRTFWSFDMLGEGARTWHDADHYFAAYERALNTLAEAGAGAAGQGVSVKLSALHPRFEAAHAATVIEQLRPRLLALARLAAHHQLLLTLDAEESDRLALQLQVLHTLMGDLATPQVPADWAGLGLAVQAYQLRAPQAIEQVVNMAREQGRRLTIRLVKGAYWDGEIKRAQVLGLPGYPVFTRKSHTDLSYLHCARLLLAHVDAVRPQFATHNAVTIAAVMTLARQLGVRTDQYEWQRLHGMGEATYQRIRQQLVPDASAQDAMAPVRVYAPVGPHRDLLAYLVRRLLENGANSSFVHQLADARVPVDDLLASPWEQALKATPGLPAPVLAWGGQHPQAPGRDLCHDPHRLALLAAVQQRQPTPLPPQLSSWQMPVARVAPTMATLQQAWPAWEATPMAQRAEVLARTAHALTEHFDTWVADLVAEGRKTLADAVAEVRETIDFAHYYAQQARQHAPPTELPAPTGERNTWALRGRGVFVCIAPWNFPLAIFGGQVMAALVMGNAVAAKSAPQTPQVAERFVQLLHACGVPAEVLAHVPGGGEVGEALVADPVCAGVAFTGSVRAAKAIQRALAAADKPIVPFIAETGGLNAMVVDSSALPEQVVDTVVQSAFHSAGQRCSALRVLCLHEAIAPAVEAMLVGAMQTLRVGPPDDWATDVGPVIDDAAGQRLHAWLAQLQAMAAVPDGGVVCLGTTPLPRELGQAPCWVAPSAWRLPTVQSLKDEHFGPVLHVVHWGPGTAHASLEALMAAIASSGYGLTLGLHTRIEQRVQQVAQWARVGNVYVNRGMTGAVVGAQPFGGQGWSGTGPKAGGPLYLPRFATEQVVSVNTAAAGGNVGLLASSR